MELCIAALVPVLQILSRMREDEYTPFTLSFRGPLGGWGYRLSFFCLCVHGYMLFFWWVWGDPLGVWGSSKLYHFTSSQEYPKFTSSTRLQYKDQSTLGRNHVRDILSLICRIIQVAPSDKGVGVGSPTVRIKTPPLPSLDQVAVVASQMARWVNWWKVDLTYLDIPLWPLLCPLLPLWWPQLPLWWSPPRTHLHVVYVFDINRPSLPTPFYSVLVSLSVTALRFLTQFFQRYLCLTGSFNCVSLYVTLPQPWYNLLWLTGLLALTN